MKTSIRLTALFLLLGTGAFATGTIKRSAPVNSSTEVAINGMGSQIGVRVSVDQKMETNPLVTIVDQANNIIYKCRISGAEGSGKLFDLSLLDNGNYAVSVAWNNHEVKKTVHIYDQEIQKKYAID